MRKKMLTQTDTATWAADSAGIATDLERNGVITRITATAEVTPSATFDGANQVDGLWRIVQNLRVVGGAHTYFNLPADDAAMGGTLLHYLNALDTGMVGHSSGDITAPDRTYVGVNFMLHCGSRPRVNGVDNPFDLSGLIPGLYESQLRAEWVTSGNDVMDDTVTIGSATMRFTLHYIAGTHGEIVAEMARQGVYAPVGGAHAMIPAWTSEVFAHTSTKSDYTEERNLPLGGYLRRIGIACQDATATRSIRAEDEVTGVRVKINEETLLQAHADALASVLPLGTQMEADEGAADFGGYSPKGIIPIDLRPFGHSDYGINLAPRQVRSAKLGLTITTYASGDDSLILYERYEPYTGRLGF